MQFGPLYTGELNTFGGPNQFHFHSALFDYRGQKSLDIICEELSNPVSISSSGRKRGFFTSLHLGTERLTLAADINLIFPRPEDLGLILALAVASITGGKALSFPEKAAL